MSDRIEPFDSETHLPRSVVLTALRSKISNTLSLTDFDAVDGDYTDAMAQAVVLSISQKQPLLIPGGSFKVGRVNPRTAKIYSLAGGNLVQRSDTEPIFQTDANETAIGTLAANVNMGATTATITGYLGNLVKGDLVILADNANYDPNGTSTRSGEILEIASVSGNVLTFATQVRGSFASNKSYTTANGAYINKLNMYRGLEMHGVSFEGRLTATVPLINMYYIRDARFSELKCIGGGDNFLSMKISKSVTADKINVENLVDDLDNNHIGYGVHVSNAADDILVTGLQAKNVRHGFTTTGGGKGIPRNIVVDGANVSGCNIAAGIDTHAAGDNIVISNSTVTSCAIGITVRGKNTLVEGNLLRQNTTGIRFAETVVENAFVKNNVIENSTYAILNSDSVKEVHIQGNSMKDFTGASGFGGVAIQGPIDGFSFQNNELINGAGIGMSVVSTCQGTLIKGNDFTDMSLTTASMSLSVTGSTSETVSRFDVVGNTFTARRSTLSARAVNCERKATIIDNRLFGTFTSSTKFNALTGSVLANNLEYA